MVVSPDSGEEPFLRPPGQREFVGGQRFARAISHGSRGRIASSVQVPEKVPTPGNLRFRRPVEAGRSLIQISATAA